MRLGIDFCFFTIGNLIWDNYLFELAKNIKGQYQKINKGSKPFKGKTIMIIESY
ncbi:hypothetical protein FB2170_11481 [Maribacter sp. HTCC2170]|nr:hypothetical protein FB2170_11481 [Maribacter sp. HTCC2170]